MSYRVSAMLVVGAAAYAPYMKQQQYKPAPAATTPSRQNKVAVETKAAEKVTVDAQNKKENSVGGGNGVFDLAIFANVMTGSGRVEDLVRFEQFYFCFTCIRTITLLLFRIRKRTHNN